MTAFLRIAGDYTGWNVYRKSVVICDVTEMFIRRALPPKSRTVDQMAARRALLQAKHRRRLCGQYCLNRDVYKITRCR